jgi:hypothetical protein
LVHEDVNATGRAGADASQPLSSARGPILIGAAVVVGIVLFLVVHHSGSAAVRIAAQSSTSSATATTPTTSASTHASGLPAAQVRLIVANGAGLSVTAASKIATLRRQGYPIVATVNTAATTGNQVACKTGFSAEGHQLAKVLGAGSTIQPFPTYFAPSVVVLLDCLVTIGK